MSSTIATPPLSSSSSSSSSSIVELVTNFLYHHRCEGVCPHSSCFWSVVRGFRNGVVYGAKVRAPHALVMTFLFKQGTLQDKLSTIVQATYTHSRNLGTFVAIYKFLVCVLRHIRGKESGLNAFLAGAVGATFVWGEQSAVNSQINMYILSRITLGLVNAAVKRGIVVERPYAYQVYASVIWGCVMYLFHYEDGTLQPSLIGSMDYLYKQSDVALPRSTSTDIVDWLLN